MNEPQFRSVHRPFTPEERHRFEEAKRWAEEHKDEILAVGRQQFAAMEAVWSVVQELKQAREARGLSLADVAERSGIDKSNLSKLENDRNTNPTLATLTRIASAIGVRLVIGVTDDAA